MDSQYTTVPGLNLPAYSQLLHQYDPQRQALWYYMNPEPRPCFTTALLDEILDLQGRVAAHLNGPGATAAPIHYLVMASATPRAFSLGGDLDLFVRYIGTRNRDGLYEYGRLCVDALYRNFTNLGIPALTSISLVQGMALGGGLEAALGQNVLIAEQSAQLGFPEILFNLFPGMGAYSLLSRRIEPCRAEQLLRSGEQHSAEELWKTGIVDVLAPDGEGVHAANEFMRRHSRSRNGQQAIQQVRQRVNPLAYQELLDVVEIWVDAALRLTPRDLRMMTRLVAAQQRLELEETEPEAVAA
jgi:DSF synthase